MKQVVIFTSLLFLITSFKPYEKKSKSIELIYHNNLYFVEVELNHKKANLLVDTGAAASLLDINQASEYKFKFHLTEQMFAGVGGITERYKVSHYNFAHDSSTLSLYPFGANLKILAQTFKEKGMPIAGILGSDFFRNNDAIIDYKNKKLIINH
jgi:hypothetical protein